MKQKLNSYWRLMRFDKPIGIWLLLLPTLWALWLAASGPPPVATLVIFIVGTVLMRAAGCVINDYADRHFDGRVTRTHQRPIVSGEVSPKAAITLFFCLLCSAFFLVLLTNKLTLMLSFVAVLLAASYPFCKRFMPLPQVVLGAAFAWSIPMAFTAINNRFDSRIMVLYIAVLLWTLVYDTFYAMADQPDDEIIGINSSAIFFAPNQRLITAILQFVVIVMLLFVGLVFSLTWPYFVALIGASGCFVYQQYLLTKNSPASYMAAFYQNRWLGVLVMLGIVFSHGF